MESLEGKVNILYDEDDRRRRIRKKSIIGRKDMIHPKAVLIRWKLRSVPGEQQRGSLITVELGHGNKRWEEWQQGKSSKRDRRAFG